MLGDLLGRGGMAEVFSGHAIGDHGFQKPVAIKRLLPELANDTVFVERLISEAKLLVGMTHGNIVSVIDLAREGDDVFLVMEYVDGPSLRQLLKARGTRGLSLGTATYIVQAAAAGLEFAHARPGGAIIHADISPSNLLLTTSGEVRVADFGIARREGGGNGIVEGKWAYMAPEQARGEPLTARADVFALGVVLYELICGAHPFGRQVTAGDREEAEPMRVIPPRIVRPTIPPGLDAICMRALAHDPRDRYGRMQYVIDALVEERFANGYRESASDLAQAIREVVPNGNTTNPRTQHTDRPVTIMTRSLLLEKSQPRRSAPRLPDSGGQAVTTEYQAQMAAAAEESSQSQSQSQSEAASQSAWGHAPQPAAPLFEIPALARADGTPMPPFRLSAGMMPSSDLASVIGGHTVTGTGHQGTEAVESRSHRLAFIVLGIATIVGAVAAVVMQVGDDATPPATDQAAIAPVKVATPPPPVPPPDDHAAKPDETKTTPDQTQPAPPVDTKPDPATPPPVAPPLTETDKPADKAAKPAAKDDAAKPDVTAHKAPAGAGAVAPASKKKAGCQSPEHVDPFDNRPLCNSGGELTALRIWSKPWATVTIDEQYVGETPSLVVKVARGKHYIRLSTNTGVTKREMINVGKEVQTLRYNMEEDEH